MASIVSKLNRYGFGSHFFLHLISNFCYSLIAAVKIFHIQHERRQSHH